MELLREFYARDGGVYGIPFSARSADGWIRNVLDCGFCLVGPGSCAGVALSPFQLNNRATVAYVEFWYFRRAREITIFDAVLEQVRQRGAVRVFVDAQAKTPAVERYYRKKGLQQCATQFSACVVWDSLAP